MLAPDTIPLAQGLVIAGALWLVVAVQYIRRGGR
jgi:hypothetical protein